VVHVAGAVNKPGVYHLKPGARGEDALKAAGGPAANARTDAINLAARLEDGTQLYFPTRAEQPSGGAAPAAASSVPSASAAVSKKSGKPGAGSSPSSHRGRGGGDKPAKLSDPSQGTVNINTASADELQRLPGIGPAMAERILAYRLQNHGFKRVEDLLEISGIGEKKFAKLQAFVRVH
jgi:competence protein ComEA